jgi:hypothetical protein
MGGMRRSHRGLLVGLAVTVGLGLAVAPLLVRGSLGSVARAEVSTAAATDSYVPQKRVYYIAAEELPWNYAPSGKDREAVR